MKEMSRGWFIGNFSPSILKTEDFEVGLLSHTKGEDWPEHYHKVATEYNVLLSGKMNVNGEPIAVGDIFVIYPNEKSKPDFLEDCLVLCVKTPSVIGDKYIVAGE